MNTTLKPKELKSNRRAVAPVIATLLMVAIAVVGGTIIFVFSQGFFSSSQISGVPTIEAIKVLGYDARDAATLTAHDGVAMTPADSAGVVDGAKSAGERIAVYLKNDSVQKITVAELSFAGQTYAFNGTASSLDVYTGGNIQQGGFAILESTPDVLVQASAGEIRAGQVATLILDLDQNIKIGRDSQFKLTTTNGAVIVHTVNIGQQSG